MRAHNVIFHPTLISYESYGYIHVFIWFICICNWLQNDCKCMTVWMCYIMLYIYYIHIHTYIHTYIYMCVCPLPCACCRRFCQDPSPDDAPWWLRRGTARQAKHEDRRSASPASPSPEPTPWWMRRGTGLGWQPNGEAWGLGAKNTETRRDDRGVIRIENNRI